MVFFNWKGPKGRETVDELDRNDFPAGKDGHKQFRAEVSRLCHEYAMSGMAVYTSSRSCANWKG